MQAENAAREAERLALDARTIDSVAPGEQQPETDHFFKEQGLRPASVVGDVGVVPADGSVMSLMILSAQLSLSGLLFSTTDVGWRFKIIINTQTIANVELAKMTAIRLSQEIICCHARL